MFDELRAAQMAAYFLSLQGGQMSVLKLMKLMYLADRKSLQMHGHPITFDRMVSMDHGPVLSSVYNLTQGARLGDPNGWEYWISDRANHDVSLRRSVKRDLLEDLSDADMDIIKETWNELGHLKKWDLVEYTHRNLKEWEDPDGSSLQIQYEAVFAALGYSPARARTMAEHLDEQASIRRNLKVR